MVEIDYIVPTSYNPGQILRLAYFNSTGTKPSANTVYIGFCDQRPSRGSRSLNPMEVAKSSGFPLGIATR